MTGWSVGGPKREFSTPTADQLRRAASMLEVLAAALLGAGTVIEGADLDELRPKLDEAFVLADELHSWAEALDSGAARWEGA